jgi:hypothetical protein
VTTEPPELTSRERESLQDHLMEGETPALCTYAYSRFPGLLAITEKRVLFIQHGFGILPPRIVSIFRGDIVSVIRYRRTPYRAPVFFDVHVTYRSGRRKRTLKLNHFESEDLAIRIMSEIHASL